MKKLVAESLNEYMGISEEAPMNIPNLSKRDLDTPLVDDPALDEEAEEYINNVNTGIKNVVGGKVYRVLWPTDETPGKIWNILENVYGDIQKSPINGSPILDEEGTNYGTVQSKETPEGTLVYAYLDYNENGSYYLADEKMVLVLMRQYPELFKISTDGYSF